MLGVHAEVDLLERSTESSLIDEVIGAAAAGRGQVLLLERAPGPGKTRLAALAADRAAAAGLLVLRARGAELERDLGWGVVRELFGALLPMPGGETSCSSARPARAHRCSRCQGHRPPPAIRPRSSTAAGSRRPQC